MWDELKGSCKYATKRSLVVFYCHHRIVLGKLKTYKCTVGYPFDENGSVAKLEKKNTCMQGVGGAITAVVILMY